jgi:hypothetical protein
MANALIRILSARWDGVHNPEMVVKRAYWIAEQFII